jgi:cellulose synthase/poly-beta-1,6-N-acetylglucosamine synthase-like glycosyltransferase
LLSQRLVAPELLRNETEFSVGICAADHAKGIDELLSLIEHETYPAGIHLAEIMIVASGLDQTNLARVRRSASRYGNVTLIEEPTRHGKAEAINRIIDCFAGRFLILVNSDARPYPGAISELLRVIVSGRSVGLVSASPSIGQSKGVTGALLRLMWAVHNECLATLNEAQMNNHCCDELMVVRTEALRRLPNETVNDGAFLAGCAYQAGYVVEFSRKARVWIDVPDRISDLLMQRRRIVYGHMQILRSLGESPRTIESMLFNNPRLGLSILIKTLAKSPKLTLVLPVAVVCEVRSSVLAAIDGLAQKKHVPWVRIGRKT